ncbi:unnamed protein product [Mesocestoides corti]|uniref:C2 domain-containing protein n=1 Tax=Mesocestoides corti TaxID=53468 RepID=A0A158QRZ3_MESCO|nr:unnamed protein product [Mesocestoides corti]
MLTDGIVFSSHFTPAYQVVHQGSKVFQRLPPPADPSSSSASAPSVDLANNTSDSAMVDRPPVTRSKDEFFGGVTRRGKSRDAPAVHHTHTSGDLLGVVSNFVAKPEGGRCDVCEICNFTKFAGIAGHRCAQCNRKTCARCGGWFGSQSSWVCKTCFGNLSSPSSATCDSEHRHGAKRLTGPLSSAIPSHGRESSSSPLSPESSPHPRLNVPTSSATITASPTEGAQSGYAGAASRARLRNTMRDHRSASEEEHTWIHFQPTLSSHTHYPHPHHPTHNYYHHHPQQQPSTSTVLPQYQQQHFTHYPSSSTAVTHHCTPPQLRHAAGPASGRALGDSWSHPGVPPPLRFKSHTLRTAEYGRSSTLSCGSAEGSPHGDFNRGYLQRTGGGGQPDPGSVSEPCQPETFLRGQYRKSFINESRRYQQSVDADRPTSKRSAFWSSSPDGTSLTGQVYLRKLRGSSGTGLLSSFGLKLVIGKRVPSDMVGTFVSSVKEGSVADVMGELQIGDEILEWNGHSLRGLHQKERAQRNALTLGMDYHTAVNDFNEESDGATSSSLSRHGEETNFPEDEDDDYRDTPVQEDADPHLQLTLLFDEKRTLIVSILAARDLPPQFNTKSWLCNSFCQISILPETDEIKTRCTKVVYNTNDPVWNHNFAYQDFEVESRELEVAVFDYHQNKPALIGEVLINLQVADLSGRAYWYPIPPPWEAADLDPSNQATDDWSDDASDKDAVQTSHQPAAGGKQRTLRAISPRSVPSQLSSVRHHLRQHQRTGNQRNFQQESRIQTRHETGFRQPSDRWARFTLSEDEQSFLSDNSEASGFSSFSKLSLQSSQFHHRQRLIAANLGSARQSHQSTRNRSACHSPTQELIVETGEEEDEDERNIVDERKQKQEKETKPVVDQPKANFTEDKSTPSSMATMTAANEVKTGVATSAASANSAHKKSKASFQRSEEVLPAHIQTNEKATVSGGYKAPGAVAEGAGFGGIAASSVQPGGGATGYQGSHHIAIQHHTSTSLLCSTAGRKDQLALEMGEVHVGEFVEGLGPGQLVGRQVLGMPCLGEIQLSFFDRKGHLEVEVIRARGLQQKNTSKPLPTPYVKLHLLEGKQSVEKMRTTAPARLTSPINVSVWGEYGRMDKKVFLGMCEIVLDDLDLRSIVFGWYKLFGMIAATAQHHKQVRRHSGASSNAISAGAQRTSSRRHASKTRQSRVKS